jgi:hypothetical protein
MTDPFEASRGRRAFDLPELFAKMSRLVSASSYEAGCAFAPRPNDIIIAPYAKCGTTWLQQMVHSLRTGGDMDFDDVSRVVPWLETAGDLGLELDAEQRGVPRAYKSHLAWDEVPKGARYIVAVRDPRDALVSAYNFFSNWFFEPDAIDVETLGRIRFLEQRGYYRHLTSWLSQRDNPDVLLLAYELMTRDTNGTVRRVAEFLGVDASDDVIATACEESSLASMQRHADKYDDAMMRRHSESACSLPAGSATSKVSSGQVGGHRAVLSDAFLAELDGAWSDTIGAQFGIESYTALLATIDAGESTQ